MKKRCLGGFLLRMCLTAALLVCLCAPVAADMSRGSKGEDVKALQSMLIDLGFLNDQADGIFGRNTQAAVKALQRCLNLDQTGVADEGVVNDLEILWQMAMGVQREPGAPDEGGYEGLPGYCSWTGEDGDAPEYCWRHREQVSLQHMLSMPDAPEKLQRLYGQRICDIWLRNIENMYQTWAREPGMEQIAHQQFEIYQAALTENRENWEKQLSSCDAILSEMIWLESMGVNLCFDMHGAEPGW